MDRTLTKNPNLMTMVTSVAKDIYGAAREIGSAVNTGIKTVNMISDLF